MDNGAARHPDHFGNVVDDGEEPQHSSADDMSVSSLGTIQSDSWTGVVDDGDNSEDDHSVDDISDADAGSHHSDPSSPSESSSSSSDEDMGDGQNTNVLDQYCDEIIVLAQKMLRDKSNIRRLTYRSSQPTQKDDKVLLNVCDSKRCDYECTDKLIDFILNAVSRKGVPEEVQWCSRIASTITQALAKARRRYDEARARREREPLLDLSEFDRTLKPSGNPLMVSCKDQPKVVPPVSEEN